MLTAAVVRCKPGPKYRDEVFAPGRQGIRAKRDFNPARGSATSFGTTHHGLFLPRLAALSCFLALSRGAAAWEVNERLKLTGAAILVFRASMFMQAAPAA
jgi:hypothetical protein